MTLKLFLASLAAIVATTASLFVLPPARAATPPHFTRGDEKPLHRIRVDPDSRSLVVHLNADGSLVVSQRDKADGAPITLPSIQSLPAEIDALVPREADRKKIVLAADATLPYRNFIHLMNEFRKAGFGEITILGPEKEPRGGPSDLVIRITQNPPTPDLNNALFVSLGNDRTVTLSLGLTANARGMRVNLAGAPGAAAELVPTGRPKKEAYFRADFEVPVGDAFDLLRALHAIGLTDIDVVAEATE